MSNKIPESFFVTPSIHIGPDTTGQRYSNTSQVTTRTVYDNYSQFCAMVIPSDGMPIRLNGKRSLPRTKEQREFESDYRKDDLERCVVITVTKTFPNFDMLASHQEVLEYYNEEHGLSDRNMTDMLYELTDYVNNNKPNHRAVYDTPYVVVSTYKIPVDQVNEKRQRVYLPDLGTIVAVSSVDFNSNFPTHPNHWVEPPAPPDVSKESQLREDGLHFYDAKVFIVDNKQRRDKRFMKILGRTVELRSNRNSDMQDGVYVEIIDSVNLSYEPKRLRYGIDEGMEMFGITAERDLVEFKDDPELKAKAEKLRLEAEQIENARAKMIEEREIRQETRTDAAAKAMREAAKDEMISSSNHRKETADILSSVIKIAAGVTAAVVSVFTMFRMAS